MSSAITPPPLHCRAQQQSSMYIHIIKGYDSAPRSAFHSLRSATSFFTRLSPSGVQSGRTEKEVVYAYSDSGWAAALALAAMAAAAAVGLAVVTFHTTLFLRRWRRRRRQRR